MYKDMMDTIGMVNAADPELGAAMERELTRQRENIELIASENIVSPAVMAAMGSVLTNKYAEGLPGKRYYGGCVYVDEVENIAIQRAEDADREYQPGQYIRTQREARDARRSNEEERGRIRVLKMAAGAVLVLLFIYLLYPKLADVFLRARTAPATETQQVGEEEFNPYAPIRVVPNDYEE